MYIPPSFAEPDLGVLHDFIEQHSFAVMASQVDGLPFATHLPFLLEREAGAKGTLIGHLARANPHWKCLESQPVLVVFSGPHAYISPTWYEAENVVPTWNYAAVHVVGRIRLVDDLADLTDIVQRMVQWYEQPLPNPWTFEDSPFSQKLLPQIVGLRLEIESIEGKWKLNQNHPVERRKKVIAALRAQPHADSQAVADLMQAALPVDP